MANQLTKNLAARRPKAISPVAPPTVQPDVLDRASRSPWRTAWRQFRRHRLAMVGLLALLTIVLSTLFGPLLYATPYNKVDFAVSSQGPSWDYPFGTNDLGQDLLARVLWGGRISVAVSLFAMLVAIGLGALMGSLAGFFGGALDSWLMRITDVFLSLPQLPLLLLIIYLFREAITQTVGPELGVFVLIVLIIGGLNWMSVARLVRANFLVLREAEFVTAAHAVGVPQHQIILRHLLPNTLGPVIVAATLAVGSAIITESSLSFLGLGFPPDTPTWGRMLFEAQNFVEFTPSMALFPGLFIFVTVLSINYIGDGLRDALDPQLRSQ